MAEAVRLRTLKSCTESAIRLLIAAQRSEKIRQG
jgi:hypothetical protein